MNRYTTVLFDMDGTLIDSGEGVTHSVAYALEKFGIHVTDRRELYLSLIHISEPTRP